LNLLSGESQRYDITKTYPGLEVVYSPDGKVIAYSEMDDQYNSTITLMDSETGDKVTVLQVGKVGHIDALVFSPDGKTLVSGDQGSTVNFWDIETGELKKTFLARYVDPVTRKPAIPDDPLQDLVFSPDGKILVAAYTGDGTIVLWDAASTHLIKILNGGNFYISGYTRAIINLFGFSSDASLLTANELIWGLPENTSRYPSPFTLPNSTPTP